jgi:hypothetical protein
VSCYVLRTPQGARPLSTAEDAMRHQETRFARWGVLAESRTGRSPSRIEQDAKREYDKARAAMEKLVPDSDARRALFDWYHANARNIVAPERAAALDATGAPVQPLREAAAGI